MSVVKNKFFMKKTLKPKIDEAFNNYTCGYVVPSKILFQKKSQIINRLRNFRDSHNEKEIEDDIFKIVDKTLLSLNQRAVVMCGGGVDSTFLLLRAAELSLNFDAVSAATGNNEDGLLLVDEICSYYGLKHYKFKPDIESKRAFLNRFEANYGRLPNDPVVPLVSQITDFSKSLNYELCIDGQFADTIFFANPQNKLAAKTMLIPGIPFTPIGTDNSHKKHKLNQLARYIFLNRPRRVLFLCRIEITNDAISFIKELLKENDFQHVMQAIFWEVLIDIRERDKYLLTSLPIVSPFDSDTLFFASATDTLGLGKKILRRYIEQKFSKAKKHLHSASFRPN